MLFKGSIRKNLLWANSSLNESEIENALAVSQSKNIVSEKDLGLDAIVEPSGRNFSGGQKQRLTIARAILKNSDVLILDDSFSALDNNTDKALRKALKSLDKAPIIFIVSQRTSTVANADKIIVLDEGSMVGYGKETELLENCDVYKEIYNAQF